jgi:hypothetical protein
MKHKLISLSLLLALLLSLGVSNAKAQGDAELQLNPSSTQATQGQEFTVDIGLKNPSLQSIISVRAWLDYDPAVLEAESIEPNSTLFSLEAPGENNISSAEGKVKIGRGNITGGMKEAEAKVATVKFKVLSAQAGKTTIQFFDYQVSENGHTGINVVEDGLPLNILSKEPQKIEIQLNPGAQSAPVQTPPPAVVEQPVTQPANPSNLGIGGAQAANDLARPQGLMANTSSGYIDLVWSAPKDKSRVGFNVYYGKTSGQYARRRTVGETTAFRLEGLNNNEAYYLAVTAYDSLNRESDYSNEVGVIVGQPLSSTAPFQTAFDRNRGRIPSQPQNGPLVGWLLFSSAGLSMALLFGVRRHRVAVESIEP